MRRLVRMLQGSEEVYGTRIAMMKPQNCSVVDIRFNLMLR